MKRTALLAAAAALMSASPVAAQGYVGLQYGDGENELIFSPPRDVETWQAEGAYGFAFSPNWRAQVDGNYSSVEVSGAGLDTWGLGGHVWWQAESWRLGVGVTTTQIDDASNATEWTYAAEGAYALGENVVVSGSFAQGTAESGSIDLDTQNIDVALAYYPTQNISLRVFGGTGEIESIDTTTYGLGGEIRPWSAPISLTLDWTKFEADLIQGESDALQIGVRWNFGAPTLRERDEATPFHLDTGFYDRLFSTW